MWTTKWLVITNKKHLKMLGPFATASRRTPPVLHCHSPGVATVARRLRIDVHNNIDNNDNNDNAWQRGPLWPHGMGPITLRTGSAMVRCWTQRSQVQILDVLMPGNNRSQVVHALASVSLTSIIWYQPQGPTARKVTVGLGTHYRLHWFIHLCA